MLKLGKKPARPNSVKFKLARYVDIRKLPTPPLHFGHEDLIPPRSWGMLGNDNFGDCVLAGAAHETMLWNLLGGRSASFTDETVLGDYAAITGFTPSNPSSDQGTDMQAAASYRLKTGMIDVNNIRHKVGAYLSIAPGDVHEHLIALYLFGAVGIGIEFPASAMDQFNRNRPWTLVKGSGIEGGHYIPLVGKRTHLNIVTWGRVQGMSEAFFKKYNDESVVYISEEMLKNGRSPEGFNIDQLRADLAQLKRA